MTTKNFVVKNGLTTGNIILDASSSNITANVVVANLSVPALANLGSVSNVKISGGTTGQYLQTDGSGGLSWVTIAPSSSYSNSNVAAYLPTYTGNVSANYFTGNGSQLTFINGANVNGNVSQAVHAYYSDIANSVAAANVSGSVANANLAQYVVQASQPNITSVGTLSSLSVSGNISAGNITATGSLTVPTIYGNVVGNISGTLSVPGNNKDVLFNDNGAAGASDSFRFDKSTNVLTLNGNLIASNANLGTSATATYITGTLTTAAQPNITSVGTLTSLSVTGNVSANYFVGNGSTITYITGSTVNGNVSQAVHSYYSDVANSVAGANVSGNVSQAVHAYYADVANSVAGANVSGNVNNAVHAYYADVANSISGSNVTGNVSNSLIAGTVYTNAQPNITSVGTLTSLSVTGNVSGNYFIGNGSTITYITGSTVNGNVSQAVHSYYSDVANSVAAANVSGSVANANLAQYVVQASQPNITSLGTLTSLTVSGDTTITGNLTVTGNYEYANVTSFRVKDPIIEQGGNPNGTSLASNDGYDRGQILHYYTTAPVDAFMGWDNSNGEFAFGSNVTTASEVVTFNTFGNLRAGYYLGNGSQLTSITGTNVNGNVSQAVHSYYSDVANSVAAANISGSVANANLAQYVVQASQPNITSVGTLTSLSVTGNVSGNYFIGNGSLLTGLPSSYANSNVAAYLPTYTGLVGGTLSTAAQPNITSVGTLTTLTVTGLVTATSGGIKVGNLQDTSGTNTIQLTNSNVSITGNLTVGSGGSGNVSATYFVGNGAFLTGITGTGTYSNANVANYLPTYSGTLKAGNVDFSTSANVTLGSVSNIHISGGTSGQYLQTDGSGALSWATVSGGGSSVYASITVDTFTGDGSTVNFTLSVAPGSKNNTSVNYNGAYQLRGAYTISGTTITFSEAPANGSSIEVTTMTGVTSSTGTFATRNYTGTGSQATFTVTSGTTESSVLVTENGVLQTPTTDYTISGATLTFVTAPASGVKIQIREMNISVATGVTGVNASVANVKISGGTSGQALITDGTGNLSFGSAGVPSGKIVALNMFLGF